VAVEIPFVKDLEFDYGRVEQISPLIRRVICNNPGPFTLYGTGTYIIGRGNVAVIDPGPADPTHIDALVGALDGEEITHLVVTHTHNDHSPGCRLLSSHTDAPTYGYGPHGAGKREEGVQVEEGGDMDFAPDYEIRHEDVVEGDGWSLEAVYTPGHTSNHLCFALREEKVLFTGDHVMGWSTSVISPPDGDMTAYMASLGLLLERDDAAYWPTHGPRIEDPKAHVRAFIAHREEREAQILACLKDGVGRIVDMVPRMYIGLNPALTPAAGRSVFAAMVRLLDTGKVRTDGEPSIGNDFYLP